MLKKKLVLVGSSTGGPGHIKKLFGDLVLPTYVSVVIAQHMSSTFMSSFVNQLNNEINSQTILLKNKEILQNKIYICEKNSIILNSQTLSACIDETHIATTFNPNVNILFNSAVIVHKFFDIFAILLTGIGDDGALGLNNLYKVGVRCMAESEESAIVYGMPKRAKEINPMLDMGNLQEIKIKLERFINETN